MGCCPPGRALVAAIAVAAAWPGQAHAERTVSGSVVDARSGEPIAGATVLVGDGETTTDASGHFQVPAAASGAGRPADRGRLDVTVIADGHAGYFGSARQGARLTIRLEREEGSSETIRLYGRSPDASPLELGGDAIRTQPGAGNDVLRALQSLPGVARTPFGLGGLALRGTAPRDTKVYLDGIEVPLLYHFLGLASFLPTGAVADVSLQPGGAGARYGRGLGGVALITSRAGRRDGWRANGEVSLLHAAAIGEGPGPLHGSWLVGFRRSYFDGLLAASGLELGLVPRYLDGQLRWESGDHKWMAIAIGSDDLLSLLPDGTMAGGIDATNVQAFDYRARFIRVGARYRATHGRTTLSIMPSAGLDKLDASAVHKHVDKGMHLMTVPVQVRAELSTPAAGGLLALGVDGGWQRHAYDLLNTPPPTPFDPSPSTVIPRSLTRWTGDAGAWIEDDWLFAGGRLELRAGLRGDHTGLSDEWSLDPRLLLRVRLPDNITIEQAAGRYHAPPLITDLDPIFGDRVMLGSVATQLATTVKKDVGDDAQLSATAYYQDLDRLPVDALSAATPIAANGGTESGGLLGISRELVDTQFGSYSYREAIGYGHAYGLELLARKDRGPWTGWISYDYARSYRVNPAHDGLVHPYVLDQPHAFTVVASTAIGRRWRLGGRFRYTTGNPYTPVGGAYIDNRGNWAVIDGPILSQRLPDFVQFDVRVDRAWHRRWGTISLYVDLQNVTNRANPEGVTYNEDYSRLRYTTGLPIFPVLGVEYLP